MVGWSPLAGGFLTGKYLNGIPEHELNRFTDTKFFFSQDLLKGLYYSPFFVEETINKLKKLDALANNLGFKLTHLALAWAINFGYLSSALIGARTTIQLEDCLRAIELYEKFTPEFEAEVNKILNTTPAPRMNYLKWTPYDPIRPIAK
jgi:aryl-alcohol dehydrogenase-like predicted oxidoreductase